MQSQINPNKQIVIMNQRYPYFNKNQFLPHEEKEENPLIFSNNVNQFINYY